MGKVVVTEEYLEDIADAIREKGVAGTFTPAQMGAGVRNIPQGGGGTTDYDQLSNKPQINGHTLAGDKSAEDLGLARSDDIPTKVSDLDNDENFISDANYVHTDNNYDDTAKGIVNGVTEALAGKQDTLTFDNIPTEDSINPVKSGGVYSADEAIRQWTTAEAKSVSGNPIVITDGSARKAEGLVVTLEPKQSGSGTPSPTNVRPITGYTECGVDRDGKNLLVGVESGAIDTTTGQDTLGEGTYRSIGYIKVSAGNYTVSHFVNNTSNVVRFFKYDANKNYLGSEAISGSTAITLAVDSSVAFIRFHGNVASFTDIYPPQFEEGETATPYEPYSHDTATITFGQTVYGGSVDFKTGKVSVTHVICTENDFGAVSRGTSGGGLNYANILPNAIIIKTTTNAISNVLTQNQSGWSSTTPCFVLNTGEEPNINPIRVYGTFESLEAFKTAYSGLQIAVELATPIELTLTPAELELLKGYNYISTNGTTIALDYLPNSLLAEAENYVDEKIPPAPSSDGAYVLTCTVTSGTPAYSWESAT